MNKEQAVEVNGIKLPITEKCKGLMGKSLENMTKEELISSVHFTYSELVKLKNEISTLENAEWRRILTKTNNL
jgi:hypothetical protein